MMSAPLRVVALLLLGAIALLGACFDARSTWEQGQTGADPSGIWALRVSGHRCSVSCPGDCEPEEETYSASIVSDGGVEILLHEEAVWLQGPLDTRGRFSVTSEEDPAAEVSISAQGQFDDDAVDGTGTLTLRSAPGCEVDIVFTGVRVIDGSIGGSSDDGSEVTDDSDTHAGDTNAGDGDSSGADGAGTGGPDDAPGESGGAPGGQPCDQDSDCVAVGLLCNDELDVCMDPGPDGTPCFLDNDCAGLCNDELDVCMEPGPDGTPCFLDNDCIGLCNDELDVCMEPGPDGTPCFLDNDCIGLCNDELDVCMAPGPSGTPCFLDNDCLGLCDDQTSTCA